MDLVFRVQEKLDELEKRTVEQQEQIDHLRAQLAMARGQQALMLHTPSKQLAEVTPPQKENLHWRLDNAEQLLSKIAMRLLPLVLSKEELEATLEEALRAVQTGQTGRN